jgi:hypothetical protein
MNPTSSVDLLLVEDNPQDLELALLALHKASPSLKIHVARDGSEALDFLFCEGSFADRLISETPRVILLVKPVNFERYTQAVRDLGMYWMLLNQPLNVGS